MLKKRRFKSENVVKVTFELPADTAGSDAYVMGDFNDWRKTHPLKTQRDGSWRVTIPLEPNREYAFRYLVDGERWVNEPAADRYERNPYGEDNSVIIT